MQLRLSLAANAALAMVLCTLAYRSTSPSLSHGVAHVRAARPACAGRMRQSKVAVHAAVPEAGRRAFLGGLAGAALVAPLSAHAGLFGPSKRELYEEETKAFLDQLQNTLALPADDEAKKDAVLALKKEGNRWVAKWRGSSFSSSPSFGNLYSVVNAVNGHYNTFGPNSNIPKKRRARVDKEISDAGKYLSKGR
jgi:photosystem II Psb27 protein